MPFLAILLSAAAILLDQAIKRFLIVPYLKPVGTVSVIPGLLNLVYVENQGAAFGILQNQRWLFLTVTLTVCALILFALFRYTRHEFFSWAASILIVAGGIGNLIDRVWHGYVVDYISITFFPFVFNFADCCVTVGTVFLIIHILFFAEKESGPERVLRTK